MKNLVLLVATLLLFGCSNATQMTPQQKEKIEASKAAAIQGRDSIASDDMKLLHAAQDKLGGMEQYEIHYSKCVEMESEYLDDPTDKKLQKILNQYKEYGLVMFTTKGATTDIKIIEGILKEAAKSRQNRKLRGSAYNM